MGYDHDLDSLPSRSLVLTILAMNSAIVISMCSLMM